MEVVVQEEIAKAREAAWGKLGRGIYATELQLQAQAQNVIINVDKHLPKSFAEVKSAEEYLASIKKTQAVIIEQRKEITSRFDAKKEELMKPEGSLNEPIKKLYDKIVAVKKAEAERVAVEQNKGAEIKALRENVIQQLARVTADFKTKIINMVDYAYEFALTKNVKPEEIDAYLGKVSERVTVMEFMANYIHSGALRYITDEIYRQHLTELWVIEAGDYVEEFRKQLKSKFEFYNISFKNKEEALKKAADEKAQALADVKTEEVNTNVAATLESSAMVMTPVSDVKALKKSYKIEMEDNEANAMLLLTAFVANMAACKTKLRLTKWFNFSIGNVITALEKLRNEDNTFQPQGIIFKEIDKL